MKENFIIFGSVKSSKGVEKWVLEATITPLNQSDKLLPLLVAILVKACRIKEC
jgi:hypothetical protein